MPLVLLALTGAFLVITAGGRTFGWTEWWAFAPLQYAPTVLRWGCGALIILSALPYTASLWQRRGAALVQQFDPASWPMWLTAPVAMALFWLFRENTWHGDALYKVALLETTPLRDNPYLWKEPLNSLLEYGLTGAVQPLGWGPEIAIALLSVAAGGVFVVATWTAARWLGATATQRLALIVALLASGTSLLWFGHVENYSWSTAMAFATLVLAAGNLQGRTPLWAVGLAGGAAVSLHPQAAFVLPALLVLLHRRRWPAQSATLVISGLVAPATTFLLLRWFGAPLPTMDGGYGGDPQLFWTPAQALAPAQLSDALQNLWVIAPLWPLWIGGAIAAAVWRQRQPSQLAIPSTWSTRVFILLTVATAGIMIYFFTFQNDLPRWRDWDLFAIAGPPLTLWGVVVWLRCVELAPDARVAATLRQMLGVGLVFTSCYAGLWIGVNHAYTLLRPDAVERDRLERFRLLDLTTLLDQATVTPTTPICPEATGCERVALTTFTMPHNGDMRPVIFAHAPATIVLSLDVPPERAFLWLSPALDAQAWGWGGDGVTFRVEVRSASGDAVLWEQHLTPANPDDRDWRQAIIPLDAYRGQRIELVLTTDPGPAGNDAADRAGWGMPWLLRGTAVE